MTIKEQYNSLTHLLPVFYQPWYLDACCEKQWELLCVSNPNNEIVLVWPYEFKKIAFFRLFRKPLLCPYLGPFILNHSLQDEALEQLRVNVLKTLPKATFHHWTNNLYQPNFIFFKHQNVSKKCTHLLDLSLPIEQLWQGVQARKRSYIRQAQHKYIFEEKPLDWATFILHHQRAFQNKNKYYPYRQKDFERLEKACLEHNAALCLRVLNQEQQILAQAMLVYDQHTMYYLLGAVAAQNTHGAMAALLWQAIVKAQQLGLKVFDFEGSMDKGIARFFKEMGAKEIPYFENNATHSWLWKLKKMIKP